MRDALSASVKIDHEEVLKVIITDLRNKRNAPSNKIRNSFDDVLLYYLGVEDFEKYITNNHEVD